MQRYLSSDRAAAGLRRLGLACVLTALAVGGAQAQATERYPEIRLVYRDLRLETPTGRQALVERVETTAAAHCERYGAQIVPHDRRAQPRFCASGVRAQMLGAMTPSLRAAYDLGRRQIVESARASEP